MKIALAQLSPVVGSFDHNLKQISSAYKKACAENVSLLLTPELSITGYPLYDFLDRPEIFEFCDRALAQLKKQSQGKACALVVGHVAKNSNPMGRPAVNAVSVIRDGKVILTQNKRFLPTYDIFDEARYFEPAKESGVLELDGKNIGIAICEDLWVKNAAKYYSELDLDALVSLSASPYEKGKSEQRESLHKSISQELGVPLLYVNQVGATDEVLFDGGSFVFNGDIKAGALPFFEEAYGVFDFDKNSFVGPRFEKTSEDQKLLTGLVHGIKSYFSRTGFSTAIIGLSGGIDSAVVGALVTKALGSDRVLGVAMASQHSSSHSLEDAEVLAKNLGIRLEIRPIKFMYSTIFRDLSEGRGKLDDLASQNLQARLRGMILMTLANHYQALVVTTGNKSELATGYCTLYGDMAGAIAPIGDLFKTQVYELARLINKEWANPIPERSITKPPSAELKPDQKDEDTLLPYQELDPILEDYIEKQLAVSDLIKKYGEKARDMISLVEVNEYKRRQAAPVLKVSSRAFGIGRRVPIAKGSLLA